MEIRNDRLKGMSYTELGRKYHIDPRTAKRYAESPQRPEYTLSVPKPTKLDAYKQQVDQWLEEAPYSAVRILEKLKEQGFEGKYSIVKEYVRSRKMDLDEKATVRFETMPGKQGQMDWGIFEEHTVYEDGKWKKLYCFLLVLGYSRMRYIEFVTDMSTNTLIRCHQNAFRYHIPHDGVDIRSILDLYIVLFQVVAHHFPKGCFLWGIFFPCHTCPPCLYAFFFCGVYSMYRKATVFCFWIASWSVSTA